MNEFELKLGATTYKCTSNQSSRDNQNWYISAKFNDLSLNMSIRMWIYIGNRFIRLKKAVLTMKTITETMWMCVNDNEVSRISLEYLRKESIAALLSNSVYSWKEAMSFGWKCVKVKVTIEVV